MNFGGCNGICSTGRYDGIVSSSMKEEKGLGKEVHYCKGMPPEVNRFKKKQNEQA